MALSSKEIKLIIGATDKTGPAFSEINKRMKSLATASKQLVTGLAAVGVALGTRSMVKAGRQSLELADKYAKMSRSIGISVESLSAFNHAAGLSGTSFDQLAAGIGRLSRNIKDTADGTSEAKDTFEALGISVTNSTGGLKNAEVVVLELADKFKSMKDGTEKTAISMELFGRTGVNLIPMLNSGAAGIKSMQAEAERLGVTFDTKTANGAERINDNFLRMSSAMSGLTNKVMARLVPDMENLSNMMFAAASNTAEMDFVAKTVSESLKLLATAAVGTGAAFQSVGQSIGATAAAALFAAEGDYTSANKVLIWGAEDAANSVEKAFQRIERVWEGMPDASRIVKTEVVRDFGVLSEKSKEVSDAIESTATVVKNNMANSVSEGSKLVDRSFSRMGDSLAEFTTTGKANFKDLANSIISDMMRMVVQQNVTTPLAAAFSTFASELFSGPSYAMGSQPSAGMGPALADGGVFSDGHLQAFASGGIVNRPTLFPFSKGIGLMGEAGAEAILPLTRIGGKLGVKAQGGGRNIKVDNHYAIDARGATSDVVPSIMQAIEDSEIKAYNRVRNSLLRGGELHRLTR